METLRCKKCNNVLLEAEGKEAHIIKRCRWCKTWNEFYIKENEKIESKIIKK
jgi:phage FluMu protein Com